MPGRPQSSSLTTTAFIVLGFVQALWPLTMDLYLPSFPMIESDLGAAPAMVSLTLTGAFIGMAAGQLTAGPLSDRIGRMRPLLGALGVYVVASIGCALAPSVEVLIASRVAQGIGSSAGAVITLAIVRDCAAGARMMRLLARLQLINGSFVVLSPALGAVLLRATDWRGLFWILVAFGALLVTVVALTVARNETLPRERRRARDLHLLATDYLALLRDRAYAVALIANTLIWAGMMGYMASSSFLFQGVYGLDAAVYAVIFGGHGAVMIAAAQASAVLAGRFGPARVARVGAALAGISALSLVVSVTIAPPATLLAFLIPLFGFTGAFGVLGPCLQAIALESHAERAGTAASILGAASMIAGAVAAPLVAAFGIGSAIPASAFLAACAVAACAVVLIGYRSSRSRRAGAATR